MGSLGATSWWQVQNRQKRVLLYPLPGKRFSQRASLCPRAVMVLKVVMDSESNSTNYDWGLWERKPKTNHPFFLQKTLSWNLLEAEKNLLGRYCCTLALLLSIPVAGHVCLDRGLATNPPSLLQVDSDAQVAERDSKKHKAPKKPQLSRDGSFEPLTEAGQTPRVLLALPPCCPWAPHHCQRGSRAISAVGAGGYLSVLDLAKGASHPALHAVSLSELKPSGGCLPYRGDRPGSAMASPPASGVGFC